MSGPLREQDGRWGAWMSSDDVVRWTTKGPVPVVHLAGEIDLANAVACFDAVKAELAGADVVVVDLSAVSFIDSSALRELLIFGQSRQVRVVAPSGHPRRILTITAMDKVFQICDTVSDALRHDERR